MATRKNKETVADDTDARVSTDIIDLGGDIQTMHGIAGISPGNITGKITYGDPAKDVREFATALHDAIRLAVLKGYSVSANFNLDDLKRIVISETGKVKK